MYLNKYTACLGKKIGITLFITAKLDFLQFKNNNKPSVNSYKG